MAYGSKKAPDDGAYRKLKADLAAGRAERLYVLYGEEDYLKSYYLGKLRALCAGPFGELGETVLDAEHVTLDALTDAVDSVPFGSERKLVLVRDYPLMQPKGALKEALPELLAGLPDYICLVFFFEALEFKPDKRLTLYKTLEKHGQLVEFRRAPASDLIPWLKRRFFALGKTIETADCDYMLFLCGSAMTNLVTEVDKIAAGVPGPRIARADIDRLGSRVLEANVFQLTDKLLEGDGAAALALLRDLFDLREEPPVILGAVAAQFRRLYGARLAMDAGKSEQYVADLFGFRSSYPAQMAMRAARRRRLPELRRMQLLCLQADLELKSNNSDPLRTLELLLLRAAEGQA